MFNVNNKNTRTTPLTLFLLLTLNIFYLFLKCYNSGIHIVGFNRFSICIQLGLYCLTNFRKVFFLGTNMYVKKMTYENIYPRHWLFSYFQAISFSVLYKQGNILRSLDIVCKDRTEYDTWTAGIEVCSFNDRSCLVFHDVFLLEECLVFGRGDIGTNRVYIKGVYRTQVNIWTFLQKQLTAKSH